MALYIISSSQRRHCRVLVLWDLYPLCYVASELWLPETFVIALVVLSMELISILLHCWNEKHPSTIYEAYVGL